MPGQKLAVMLYRRSLAELGPIRANGAYAMRANGNDLLHLVLL